MRTHSLPAALVLATLLGGTQELEAKAQTEPPIRIVIDIHMDPMYQFPTQVRKNIYHRWIADTDSLLDIIAAKGAKISFLSCGEFMEYVVDDGGQGSGAKFLRRLYSLGGNLGSHSHNEHRLGPHRWIGLPPGATLQQVDWVWRDNIQWTDRAINLALGTPLPEPIRAINGVRGTHVPKGEVDYHSLMRKYAFTVREGGPEEDYYALFTHYIYHPYRPSAGNVLAEDLSAPFVCVPQAAVMGLKQVHKGVPQDCTIKASKTLFLQEFLNWRRAERLGTEDKVWVFGHGSHGSDLRAGSLTRLGWIELVAWLSQRFIGKKTSRGSTVAVFDTQRGVGEAYFAWEKANKGRSSHDYPLGKQSWAHYPWLRVLAEELAGAHLESEPQIKAGVQAFVFVSSGRRVMALYSDTSSGTLDVSSWFPRPTHIVNAETGKFLGQDPTKTPFGTEAILVAEGLPWVGISGRPELGQLVGLELQGRPGQSALLVLGHQERTTPAPPYGTLYIDLGQTWYLLGPISLDGKGSGTLPLLVPPDPLLSGMRFFVQAFTYGSGTDLLSENHVALDLK